MQPCAYFVACESPFSSKARSSGSTALETRYWFSSWDSFGSQVALSTLIFKQIHGPHDNHVCRDRRNAFAQLWTHMSTAATRRSRVLLWWFGAKAERVDSETKKQRKHSKIHGTRQGCATDSVRRVTSLRVTSRYPIDFSVSFTKHVQAAISKVEAISKIVH